MRSNWRTASEGGPYIPKSAGARGPSDYALMEKPETTAASRCIPKSAGEGLDPASERLPSGRLPQGNPRDLDEDQECAAEKCDALEFARRPQVVESKKEKEAVANEHSVKRFAVEERDGPTGEGGGEQGDGGDEDQTLVDGRVGAKSKSEKAEDGEIEHVGDRDDVKKLGINPGRRGAPRESVSGGEDAKDDHEGSETEAEDAQAAVDVNAMGGNQRGLHEEEQYPTGKSSAVEVNDESGERRSENAGEVVGVSEADEDGNQDEKRHRGEEEMVVAAAGRGVCRNGCLIDDSGDNSSVTETPCGLFRAEEAIVRGIRNAEFLAEVVGVATGSQGFAAFRVDSLNGGGA